MKIALILIIVLFAILLYHLTKWIFKTSNIGNDNNRGFIAAFSTIILVPILLFSIIVIWFSIMAYYPDKKFDRQGWITNKFERYEMSHDIIKSRMLIGKTKSEVIVLLGDEYRKGLGDHVSYDLGSAPGQNFEAYVLDIYFENLLVVRVEQNEED